MIKLNDKLSKSGLVGLKCIVRIRAWRKHWLIKAERVWAMTEFVWKGDEDDYYSSDAF